MDNPFKPKLYHIPIKPTHTHTFKVTPSQHDISSIYGPVIFLLHNFYKMGDYSIITLLKIGNLFYRENLSKGIKLKSIVLKLFLFIYIYIFVYDLGASSYITI